MPFRLTLVAFALALAPAAHSAEKAPDFATVTNDGSSIKLSEQVKQQQTVLLFWASWCPYCKALMPHLHSLKLEYGDELRIVAIHFRDDAEGQGYVERMGYDFTVVPDGGPIARRYGIHGTPGLIVPDSDLNVAFDLRELPRREFPDSEEALTHTQKAAFRAPYWAAEIRRTLDRLDAAAANGPEAR
ncbi:MAG: TlpA disulfide reductase family protein [Pseudomonadota bacterium]